MVVQQEFKKNILRIFYSVSFGLLVETFTYHHALLSPSR